MLDRSSFLEATAQKTFVASLLLADDFVCVWGCLLEHQGRRDDCQGNTTLPSQKS